MRAETKPTSEEYRDILETHKTGKKILDDLTQKFCKVPRRSGGIDRVIDAFVYQGRQEVIEYIYTQID